jgi:hypothetical protein
LASKPIKFFKSKATVFLGIFLMFIGFSSLLLKLSSLAVEHCH